MIGLTLGAALAASPNLVLVSIDGLRADRVGAYGASPSPTPGLDRLAAGGLVCEVALSQSNESLFSHAALLTGRHPSEIALPDYRTFTVPETAILLPEILEVYGYHRAAFVAGGHVKGVYGFAQGFEEYWDDADFGAFFHTVPQAERWLAETPGAPFFLFLHGYDTHRPYLHSGMYFHVFDADYTGTVDEVLEHSETERILDGVYYPGFPHEYFWHAGAGERILDPGGYASLRKWAATHEGRPLDARDRAHILAHYDSGAFSADLQLTRFVDTLRASGAWANTLMVIVADHGEDLGEHGVYNHRSTLADSATRVPMVVVGGALPAALRGTRIPGPCAAVDVVPTMLAAAGAVAPPGLPGHDLLAAGAGHEVVIQEGVLPMIAVRSATHRLTVQGLPLDSPMLPLLVRVAPITAPTFMLTDLVADPRETTNVLDSQPEVARELRARLLGWLDAREPAGSSGRSLDPASAFGRLLKERGYW